MFDIDDPTKTAEEKMSTALVLGCILALGAVFFALFLLASLLKVWL